MIKLFLFLFITTLFVSCGESPERIVYGPCSGISCSDTQICKVKNDIATCVCAKGYTGENCDTNIDDCLNNQCQNNARCVDYVDFYTCQCKDGFKGKYCEIDINECEHSDCQNDSTCIDGIEYYICECQEGFLGDYCEVDIDDCINNNCQNNSECVDGINFYTCECQEGYSGDNCEVDDRSFNDYSLGVKHTCQIDEGKLYCWGNNEYGQLGIGNTLDQSIPQRIGDDNDWEQIVSNDYSNCAIKSGDLYCWGKNEFGILGIGHEVNQLSPQKVNNLVDLEDEVWEKIVMNNNFACGIQSGKLFCWGSNELGQLGNGTIINKSIPNKVNNRTNWTKIILGDKHVCGIENNKLYCWGNNEYGQIGNGNLINQTTPQEFDFLTETESNSWDKVVLGHHNTCGIKEGYLYCWGAKILNYGGGPACIGCGVISKPSPTLIPYKVDEDNTWTDISLGEYNFLGIKNEQLYYWGRSSAKIYVDDNGRPWDLAFLSPELYERNGFYNYGWTKVSTKNYYNVGIQSGRLYRWKNDGRFEPVLVQEEFNWTSVKQNSYSCPRREPFCKKNHICGMTGGKLSCIGDNYNGEAGVEIPNIKIPQKVEIDDASYVYLSEHQSYALKDKKSYTWGKDKDIPELEEYNIDFDSFHPNIYYSSYSDSLRYYYHAIFNNKLYRKYNSQDTFTPVNEKIWTKISTFEDKYCAISEGELFCNSSYTKFGTKNNWQDISVAENHICGIESGKLYCWGSNEDGQLGIENISNSDIELQVGTKSNWQAISTRNNFSCGLESEILYCWGNNEYGQLGTYDRTNKPVPTRTGYILTHIALGDRHVCGMNSGKLYCWGDNNEGQLGINNKELKTSPQQVGTRDNWDKVFLGVDNTCAITGSELYCWGNNRNNQLGLGIDYDIEIPTEVIK